MTANPTECSFDICSEDSQSTLHDENETTVRFATIINGTPCQARVLCKPCRHPHSHLTAHDCEIRYTIPPGASIEAANQWKHSIAAEARRLCPKHSSTHAVAVLQAGQVIRHYRRSRLTFYLQSWSFLAIGSSHEQPSQTSTHFN
jgi:hypothetical protein